MIRHGMFVCALLYLACNLKAQVSLRWDKIIESTSYLDLDDISYTEDGGCIIVANSNAIDGIMADNHGSTDNYIAKYDAQGELVWDYVFGGSGLDDLSRISTNSQGDYILVGRSTSSDGDLQGNPEVSVARATIVKMSDSGEVVWVNVFDEDLNILALEIDDEDHIYTVSTALDMGISRVKITKFDDSGAELWNNLIDIEGFIAFGAIAIDSESNVYGANTLFQDDGSSQLMITKFDVDGNELWRNDYGGNNVEFGGGLVIHNNSLLLVGDTNSTSGTIVSLNDDRDAFVATIDFDGNLIRSVTLGGMGGDDITDILINKDKIFISGTSQSLDGGFDIPFPGSNDIFLAELDDEANLLWIEYSGGSDAEYKAKISMVGDSVLVLSYRSLSQDGNLEGANDEEGGYIAYFDYQDVVSVSDFDEVPFSVFPNPSTETITLDLDDIHLYSLKIHGTNGALLMHNELLNDKDINISNLPSGLMHITLYKDGKKVSSQSVLKE